MLAPLPIHQIRMPSSQSPIHGFGGRPHVHHRGLSSFNHWHGLYGVSPQYPSSDAHLDTLLYRGVPESYAPGAGPGMAAPRFYKLEFSTYDDFKDA